MLWGILEAFCVTVRDQNDSDPVRFRIHNLARNMPLSRSKSHSISTADIEVMKCPKELVGLGFRRSVSDATKRDANLCSWILNLLIRLCLKAPPFQVIL